MKTFMPVGLGLFHLAAAAVRWSGHLEWCQPHGPVPGPWCQGNSPSLELAPLFRPPSPEQQDVILNHLEIGGIPLPRCAPFTEASCNAASMQAGLAILVGQRGSSAGCA